MGDIETDPPESGDFTDYVDNADHKITAWSWYDTYEDNYYLGCLDPEKKVDVEDAVEHVNEHWKGHKDEQKYLPENINIEYFSFNNESSLLKQFVKIVQFTRPDYVSGWAFDTFDWSYLINRMKKFDNQVVNENNLSDAGYCGGYNPKLYADCLPAFDMMDFYATNMEFSNLPSKSLEYISDQLLDIGKIPNVNIKEEYENNRDRFIAYNLIDTQLLVGIDNLTDMHGFALTLAELAGIQVTDL
jgi:DNA polymerase elongation subunit (family B)